MPATTGAKNRMLDHERTVALYASLHTADPGDTGANEIIGGSPAYARVLIAFGVAASGQIAATTLPTWNVPPGVILTHHGLWTAATGGSFEWHAVLKDAAGNPVTLEFTEQGTLALAELILHLNA